MAGVFDFLHIKRNTAGSSNELSFDVLDSRRSADGKRKRNTHGIRPTPTTFVPVAQSAEKENSKRSKSKSPSKASNALQEAPAVSKPKAEESVLTHPPIEKGGPRAKGTEHGVMRNATYSSVPEVGRRKRARRNQRLRVGLIAAAIVVAAIGVATYFSYGYYQGRLGFEAHYAELVDRVADIDNTLVRVDEAMADPLGKVAASDVSGLDKSISSALADLRELPSDIDALAPDAAREKDRIALEQLAKTVEARSEMLGDAQKALAIVTKAGKASDKAAAVWEKVLDYDQVARESITEANAASSDAATTASMEKTKSAVEGLKAELKELKSLETSYTELKFPDQIDYLEKRISALELAIAVDEALLGGDRVTAAARNDEYNKTDKEAAALAMNLPASLDVIVKDGFRPQVDAVGEKYGAARVEVTETDADIRGFLG